MFKFTKTINLLAVIVLSGVSPVLCLAQSEISSSAIAKAKSFMGKQNTARYTLEFAHMGASYTSHSFEKTVRVKDRSGNTIPGEFAVIYNFVWDASGRGDTKIAFFCKKDGSIESLKVLKSTGVINSPFTFADATIQVLGQALVEAFGQNMSDTERRTVETLIRNADSEGLLELGLSFRQTMGL